MRRRTFLAVLTAGAVALAPTLGSHIGGVRAASPPPLTLTAQTPTAVVQGAASLVSQHDPTAVLTLDIGLGVHNSAGLDAFIAAASDPNSPVYGHYLTNAQYKALYAPTDVEAQAVRDWASGAGLTVVATSPDNLLVTVRGTTAQIEAALGVHINDYRLPDRAFYSNDRDATVPSGLDIRAISGLNSYHRFYTLLDGPVPAFRSGGYFPNDFRTAYNATAVGDGSGQTIGFTLWGTSVPQSDLNTFASHTGTTAIVSGQAGANGIDWIPVNGGSSDTNELVETAMDVEYAHGMAPNSHLKYWLGDCALSGGTCNPSDAGLELAISDAANDSSVHVVSNSWGGGEAASTSDPFVSNTDASFQHADAVGTTFYFSSGDNGSNSGGTRLPSFPADSPYVVSVGGTTLNTTSTFGYSSESGWSGSGGGCSAVFGRPSWQTGVSAASCSGRAEPDVAADANPSTGAWVYVQGIGQQVGGTSLAAPLWSGMAADINNNLGANGHALMGFSAPRLYQLANSATTYARDFHDVTSGSNGAFSAGTGWDEVTGWGSPNGGNLVADWPGGSSPTPTPTSGGGNPTATPTTGGNPTATRTPTPTKTPTPVSGGNCTSDGVCLTSFTASASSVPVNTNVTLTAHTNTDVGPTPYYILIVNESGTILKACGTGTTCSVTVSSSVAASHQYTAYLSTSSTSNSANAHSSSVSVTWTSGGPTPTPTKPVATNTPTRTPTRTPTPALPTATPTPAAGGGNVVLNPGFETGPGANQVWTEYSSGGYELIDTTNPHTGSYSADLCGYNNCTEYVQQQLTVPSNAALRYWWYMTSSDSTATVYDHLYVLLYNTSGTLLAALRGWSNTSTRNTWSQDTLNLAAYAGQTVRLRFVATTDSLYPTNFWIDDVAVQ